MKIINKTKWRTDHLRAFVKPLAMSLLSSPQRTRFQVTFKNGRDRSEGPTVYCYPGSFDGEIGIGPRVDEHKELLGGRIAMMIKTMLKGSFDSSHLEHWALFLPLEKQTVKVKTDARLKSAEKRLAKWVAKRKLAETYIKKCKRQIAALQRLKEKQHAKVPAE